MENLTSPIVIRRLSLNRFEGVCSLPLQNTGIQAYPQNKVVAVIAVNRTRLQIVTGTGTVSVPMRQMFDIAYALSSYP